MFDIDIDVAVSRIKRRDEKVLLIAFYEPRGVPSIVENIALLQRLSTFPISVLNLAEHRFDTGYLKIPPIVDLEDFDAIIIHNTVSYNIDNLRSLDEVIDCKFPTYSGVKIVLKQDEHYRFSEFAAFAQDAGIDCIFSIMPQQEVAKTYGRLLPDTAIRHMLTSYVTPSMRQRFDVQAKRPIDIGYRGSIMPLSFGRLCYQKRRIGDEVMRRLAGRGVVLDISSRWEDRIGGEAWFEFLASCKAVLGVESGAGLFDLDGTLAARCREIDERLGADDGSDAYAQSYLAELKPLEGEVGYFMISPRHFEAISVGAVQILFPGTYTERMVAGRHYFELLEDYSNLDEAVDLILDKQRRDAMAAAAFEEVLSDRKNWIEAFVREMDSGLLAAFKAKGRRRKPFFAAERAAKNVLMLQAHNFGCDPRRDKWYSALAPGQVLVHQIGITDTSSQTLLMNGPRNELILNVPRQRWTPGCLDCYAAQIGRDDGASFALRELYFIAHALSLSDSELFQIYGVPQRSPAIENFRWYLRYILETAVTLVEASARTEGVHALVAINFPSLVPALILKGLLGVPVIYEALEYWPEADPDQGEFGKVFWREFEHRLVRYADYRGTVSPPLARLMADTFGVPFYAVPNCAPLAEQPVPGLSLRREGSKAGNKAVTFLFQGNFAPHRGLELLIRAWSKVDPRAELVLRGPDNAFKEEMVALARGLGLSERQVSFPSAVSSERLINSAQADGDVGLVPYTPAGANYANCSPNKLSQYMAAGLPILANSTNFVKEVVEAAECGAVVDFSREAQLIEAVARLCNADFRDHCKRNALNYFKDHYNWAAVSVPFYSAILKETETVEIDKLAFFPPRSKLVPDSSMPASDSVEVVLPARSTPYKVARRVWRLLPQSVRVRLVNNLLAR